MSRVKAVVQAEEDDAGHDCLDNLEEAWGYEQKSHLLTGFSEYQPDLGGVQDEGQRGSHTGTNTQDTSEASEDDRIYDRGCHHLRERQDKNEIDGSFLLSYI